METLLRRKLGNYRIPVEEQDWEDFLDFAQKKKKKKSWLWLSLFFFGLLSLSTFGYLAQQNFFDSQDQSISQTDLTNTASQNLAEDQNSVLQDKATDINGQSNADDNSLVSSMHRTQSSSEAETPQKIENDQILKEQSLNKSESPKDQTQNKRPNPKLNLQELAFINNDNEPQNTNDSENGSDNNFEFGKQAKIESSFVLSNPSNWILENKSPVLLSPKSPENNQAPKFRPPSNLALYFTTISSQGSSSWDINPTRDSNDIIHREYANALRNNSTKFKAIGVELGIRLPLTEKLSISSGLTFNSRTQKSSFKFIRSEFPIINADDQIIAYIPDTFGVEIPAEINESIQSLRIPISMSYQFHIFKGLSLGLRGGIEIGYQNITTQKSLDPILLMEINGGQASNKASFSYSGGLFAEYRKGQWGVNFAIDRRVYNPIYREGQAINSIPKVYDFRFSIIRFL